MLLSTPVTEIPGIGTVTARNLKKIDIQTMADLLFYFPFRYDDFSQTIQIANLVPGITAHINGRIELIQNKRSPRRRMYITEALINDGTDNLRVIWFNQPFLTRNLKNGDEISLAGRVTEDYGGLVMTSPQYETRRIGGQHIHTEGIVPVYHLTGALTQKALRSVIAKVISAADKIVDWLPVDLIKNYQLLPLSQAVREIHFPKNEASLEKAKERLGFNELFLMQVRAQKQRQSFAQLRAPAINFHETKTKDFVASLPYTLTDDQKKSAWEIIENIKNNQPMLRLLQGDVGSGKTVVASIAMLNVALSGEQAALMAPTEILAAQHFETFARFFAKEQISFALLTNSYHRLIEKNETKPKDVPKKEILKRLADGEIDLVIGTHALIQKGVAFKTLALAVVDEQHRFGVDQRKQLTEKVTAGTAPHLLSMTATPIPRSLALAIYGDLEISLIKEMPAGRKKIMTKIVYDNQRTEMYEFFSRELQEGHQAFVICPLIDESDKLGFKSVKAEFERLDKTIFADYKIGLLYGKLKTVEKEKVMAEFLENKIQVLVATSIVEIGIDIPNATAMLVEDADRFGLAQLHQYRGRVGRRSQQSFCFLLTQSNDSSVTQRLKAMVELDDGFALAQADLKFRGPGEVYGLAQKGFPELKMANFYDLELIKKDREAALNLLKTDSSLKTFPSLVKELGEYEERAHLE